MIYRISFNSGFPPQDIRRKFTENDLLHCMAVDWLEKEFEQKLIQGMFGAKK